MSLRIHVITIIVLVVISIALDSSLVHLITSWQYMITCIAQLALRFILQ